MITERTSLYIYCYKKNIVKIKPYLHSHRLFQYKYKYIFIQYSIRVLLNYSKYSKNEIILSNFDLDQININLFNKILNRRLSKEPISKIINKKNFWKDEFYVNTLNSIIDTNNFEQFDIKTQTFINS